MINWFRKKKESETPGSSFEFKTVSLGKMLSVMKFQIFRVWENVHTRKMLIA